MNSTYRPANNPQDDPNLEARRELIINARTGQRDYRTIYVPKGTPEYRIPRIELELDDDGIAEARAHADRIRNELQGKA